MDLYIDPGTGSMLFAILIGIVGAVNFAFRSAWVKIKFLLSGGKVDSEESDEKLPLVIFSDDKRYWSIFEPICRELDSRGVDLEYLTCSEDDPVFECGYTHVKPKFIGKGNSAFAKLNTMKAHVLLSTTPGLDVYQWKRSPEIDCYVHIFHSVGDAQMYRMFGVDYYDVLITSGSAQTFSARQLEGLRDLPPKEVVEAGAPIMDAMADRLRNSTSDNENGEITVLIAPTWGSGGIFGKYGDKVLRDVVSAGYKVIVRPHPQSFISESEMIEELMKKYPESDRVEWDRSIDNFDSLHRSDILISDYSGIVWEFSLVHDKPVIYANAKIDKDPYDSWWVPGDTWTEKSLPSVGIELNSALKNGDISKAIDDCLGNIEISQTRSALRDEAWCNRGNSAKEIADFLVSKCKELTNLQELQTA